jgi:hypothetical protein
MSLEKRVWPKLILIGSSSTQVNHVHLLKVFQLYYGMVLSLASDVICRQRSRRGRDRMVVGFTIPVQSVSITTKVMSLNPVHGEVHLIQHYVIKYVNDLQQVCGFLWVLWFPPPIKLTATM